MTAKIKLNAASGGGSISLQAPSSSSNNRVITLPDLADGTLLTSSSSIGTRKVTYGSWVTTSSGTEIAFTSIAATTEFAIDFFNVKSAANQDLKTEIGDSGGYETSGYQTATGYAGASGNHNDPSASRWKTEGGADAAALRNGRMHLINLYGNYWHMVFDYTDTGSSPHFRFYRGTKELSGQLDRIKFDWDGGGAFDGGYMRYVKFEDV